MSRTNDLKLTDLLLNINAANSNASVLNRVKDFLSFANSSNQLTASDSSNGLSFRKSKLSNFFFKVISFQKEW